MCCLLGANGCGKTTLIRSLLGHLPLLGAIFCCNSARLVLGAKLNWPSGQHMCRKHTMVRLRLVCWIWC
ncbi:hypothetical protein [Shewanella sp.]|uniref:hypothetical protein n=1 Tax=Shewanella sp. TaxID=50422 RepID=UPI003A971927